MRKILILIAFICLSLTLALHHALADEQTDPRMNKSPEWHLAGGAHTLNTDNMGSVGIVTSVEKAEIVLRLIGVKEYFFGTSMGRTGCFVRNDEMDRVASSFKAVNLLESLTLKTSP